MQRIRIEGSSAVAEIGYNGETSTLEVMYQPNKAGKSRIYQYSPIAPEIFTTLQQPGVSVGSLLNGFVRGIPFVDVTPAEEPVTA